MPIVAVVDGIRVVIFQNDHEPPHFHAFLAEHKIKVDIEECLIMGRRGPTRMERKMMAWAGEHRGELLEAWNAVRLGRPLRRIE